MMRTEAAQSAAARPRTYFPGSGTTESFPRTLARLQQREQVDKTATAQAEVQGLFAAVEDCPAIGYYVHPDVYPKMAQDGAFAAKVRREVSDFLASPLTDLAKAGAVNSQVYLTPDGELTIVNSMPKADGQQSSGKEDLFWKLLVLARHTTNTASSTTASWPMPLSTLPGSSLSYLWALRMAGGVL